MRRMSCLPPALVLILATAGNDDSTVPGTGFARTVRVGDMEGSRVDPLQPADHFAGQVVHGETFHRAVTRTGEALVLEWRGIAPG